MILYKYTNAYKDYFFYFNIDGNFSCHYAEASTRVNPEDCSILSLWELIERYNSYIGTSIMPSNTNLLIKKHLEYIANN